MLMVDGALVGRCGLYCGACSIYRAYMDGGEYLEVLAGRWKLPKEKIRCNGCQALTPDCWGFECEIKRCLDEKGYDFCFEYDEFEANSCERYEKLAARYLKRGEDVRDSLKGIKAGETERWLEEQEKRWRCPSCGKPISVHADKCYSCGEPL